MPPLMHARLLPILTAIWLICLVSAAAPVAADQPPAAAQYVVFISIDGLRPQEFFEGADPRLFLADLGVKDAEAAKGRYLAGDREANRRKLLPYLWSRIESDGWAAGDWQNDSHVTVSNGLYFSYPGYNEMLCGFGDPRVDSNAKKYNENVTVLEWLHRQSPYRDRVMAFASWDVFPFIINDRRSGIPVNAGWMPLSVGRPEALESYQLVAEHLFHEWDAVRFDAFTAGGAIEALRLTRPRVLHVALGEPDDWAHGGRYDRYLSSAHQCDRLIQRLWDECQRIPEYAGKTAFVVTTDHGRGDGREGWKNHGTSNPGSDRVWVAAFGAGVVSSGSDHGGQFQLAQVAATLADLLGHDFTQHDPRIAPPLPCVQKTPQ